MSAFIQVEFPPRHAGLDRVAAATTFVSDALRGPRVLAAVLLGAVVSALVVVADRIVKNANGSLLLGWVVLWGLTFIALALSRYSGRPTYVGRSGASPRAGRREQIAARDSADIDTSAESPAAETPAAAKEPGLRTGMEDSQGAPACNWDHWRPIRDVGDNSAY